MESCLAENEVSGKIDVGKFTAVSCHNALDGGILGCTHNTTNKKRMTLGVIHAPG